MSAPSRLERLAQALDDPILLKELRAAFRRRRFLWLQTLLLALVAAVLLITTWVLLDEHRKDPSEIGRRTFLAFSYLELAVIFVIFPAFACTSITDERTNKSFDLLLTTELSPGRIVRGKALAAFVYGLQFIVATLPLVAITFLYGGVTPGQIVLTYVVMLAVAALVTVHALSVSAGSPSTLRSVLSTYLGLALVIVPLAAPLVTTAPILSKLLDRGPASGNFVSGILAVHVWGPLTKDEALIDLRERVRALDGFSSVLYWGGHAAFYASVASLFFIVARHRLAPASANRATALRAWFLLTFAGALAASLAGLVHAGPLSHPTDALLSLLVGAFLFLLGAALAFAGEDPWPSRRQRAPLAWESKGALRRALARGARVFLPGAENGARFTSYVALLAYGALALVAITCLGVGPERERDLRSSQTILIWGCLWSFVFVAFTVQLALFFSCELRHPAAARLCSVLALVALSLGPWLWYALEYEQKPSRLYKGYVLSPLTVAASIVWQPRPTDRQLILFGPSGHDVNHALGALDKRFNERMGPEPHPAPDEAAARARDELARAHVDPEVVAETVRRIKRALEEAPRGAVGPVFRNEHRMGLQKELVERGVPVHELSTAIYGGLVVLLALVNQRRLRRVREEEEAAEKAAAELATKAAPAKESPPVDPSPGAHAC